MSNIVIKGAVVFVTGANRERGIGRALVEEAVKRGAKKIYATARNISELETLASQYPGLVVPLSLDVTDSGEIDQVAQKASDTQILINNSGFAGYSGICFNYSDETARREHQSTNRLSSPPRTQGSSDADQTARDRHGGERPDRPATPAGRQ